MVRKAEYIQTTAAALVAGRASNCVSLSTMANPEAECIWDLAVKVAEKLAARLEANGHAFDR
jgi:hypothetical protein